ncbi:tyrosine-type recombinase/integrase [Azovibrio restrictus]|uniref:tyrosine-type recombinase/integrase n=1 Tax=Azovibrio restrictus TaxID=146938 RepID=UPI000421FD2E|nr:integrase arm-type DNA-binding domain-containing protein [Azovibrio restrictus]
MALTDTAVRNAKPADKPIKMADEKGLFLLINPNGTKYWRQKYRFDGKEKLLAHGVYPDVGLKEARGKRDEARKLLAAGVDPGENRKAVKAATVMRAANSFEVIAREWFEKNRETWVSNHADKIIKRLENDVFPWLGSKPIAEISAPQILDVLRRIENRGTLDTAHRAKGNISQVMRYAIATGRADRDPCPDLRGALPPAREKNFASITEPAKVAELLRAIDGFKGTFVVRSALLLAPLLFVRPGELRKALWADFDLDRAEWRYFVTKTNTEHSVPLATQALAILKDLQALTGHGKHVFPGRDPQKSMSEAAVNAALRRMGYDTKTEITGHGFRAMARTILHEELHQKPEVIEHQLAHKVPDALGTAYNRTKFLQERKAMMQLWADYLDKLKAGAEIISITSAA